VAGPLENLQLTVVDIEAARAKLVELGVDAGEVFHDASGVFHHAGAEEWAAGLPPELDDYGSFVTFRGPDDNGCSNR